MLFVVIARDGTDEKALARRLEARPSHIEDFQNGLKTGRNILGGAILNEQENMCGSVMVVDFESRGALEDWLWKDPYVTGKVWQDIEILPFRLAGKS